LTAQIDYAMLVKKYGIAPEAEKRYSPPVCLGTERTVVRGRPDPDISTRRMSSARTSA
jgi:hypothetical protein